MTADRFDTDLGWGLVSALRWGPRPSARERTVLLLHGGGTDSASLSWGGVGPRLAAAGYSVVAPDHPGYGHSPADLIPDARLVIAPGAGHWVQRDAPDLTVRAMTEFLDRLDW
ncbi:alpha/beta fold hydrolase [Actinophytocola gossypii]|uniref:Alpha/beta fold hydrolase n=1 Tax=Actinophytocola gossypii TaxID=2812003 RepID=A0ABT2J3Q8_9PSEU|nr:alpha/beta fold hydrolase [Actinophytocola gossypii]MCT2582145.1 alpha/beta fold hydrolase [Actinophytocola gossypii]